MNISEKLITIVENEQKVYKSGYDKAVKDCQTQVLKGTASGTVVSMTDVSPIEHEMKVKASSKNLIPYPYAFGDSITTNGVTVTDNGDGSLTLNGTSTGNVNIYLADNNTFFLPAGTYVGSLGISNTNILFCIGGGNSELTDMTTINNKAFTMTTYSTIGRCMIQGKSGITYDNVTIYPQIEKGTKATGYTPYMADVSGVKLIKQGKNLLNTLNRTFGGSLGAVANTTQRKFEFDKYYVGLSQNNYYMGEKSCKVELNGDIWTIDWSFGGDASYGLAFPIKVKPNTSYTLKAKNITEYYYGRICYYDKDGNYLNKDVALANTDKFTTPNNCEIAAIIFAQGKGITTRSTIQIKDIQLELSGTSTEYEPYIEPIEYPIAADGTVEEVTSLYPVTTLTTDTTGILIEAEYNRDINKAFEELYQAIISLGGNV
jgi:hypothetical protein